MRIVGGIWRGRPLRAPKGLGTRPTSDRVREGLFDALVARLGADLGGAVVLDAFAGTGALGLEALSRGASRAVFVERDREALRVLEANIEALGAGTSAVVIAGDATGPALARATHAGPFGLLLLDPPYRIDPSAVAGVLSRLMDAGAIAEDAVVVHEHAASSDPLEVEGFAEIRTFKYGETAVTLFGRARALERGPHA